MKKELSLQGEAAGDHLLDLVGGIAKLNVMLNELPEAEIELLSGKLTAFFNLVESLPVAPTEDQDFKTVASA